MINLDIIEPFLCDYINDKSATRAELAAPAFKFRSEATGLLSFDDYFMLKNALFLRSRTTLNNISSFKNGILNAEFNTNLLNIPTMENGIKSTASITFRDNKINTIDMSFDRSHVQFKYLNAIISEILNQDAFRLTGT